MENKLKYFKIIFIISALWNLIGAGFGYFNTAFTFQLFFNKELTDPLILAIYKGAWGTTFIYFFGYLIVARNPIKHTGIVIVGGIGKIGLAIGLLQLYLSSIANSIVFVVIIGDLIFMFFFFQYFYELYKQKQNII